jgi:hypothetical protein
MTKYRTICNISFFNSDIFIEKDNMVESWNDKVSYHVFFIKKKRKKKVGYVNYKEW